MYHIYLHTHIQTHIHTYTHTHIHTHIYTRNKLNWLNTEDSITYKIFIILKKTITYNLPYHLCNKIKLKPNTRLLRNSIKLHKSITHCIKYERKKFISESSIRWNKLPPKLRNKHLSINIFKKKLKQFLIAQH